MTAKRKNPVVEAAEQYGLRMLRDLTLGGLPGVIDGVLEDIEGVSEEVVRRAKKARGRIAERRKRR